MLGFVPAGKELREPTCGTSRRCVVKHTPRVELSPEIDTHTKTDTSQHQRIDRASARKERREKMTWVYNVEDNPSLEDSSQWRQILAICVVFSFMSVTVVSTRLWLRFKATGLAADDVMAFLAMVFALIYGILCIIQTRYGLGLIPAERPAASLDAYLKVNFAGRPFYQLGISFFKIALLISYLRLFKGTDKSMYVRTVWATIFFVFVSHLACTFCLLFACKPIYKSWTDVEGTCLPNVPSFTGYAAVTIASDIIVAVLPLPVIWNLNISRNKKIGLAAVFVLGLFTTICSILRYLQINRILLDGNSTMLVVWGVIEFNVGNMVSSLPFLAPVFVRKAKQYRTKRSRSDGSGPRRAGGGGGGGGISGYKFGSKKDHYELQSISGDHRSGAFGRDRSGGSSSGMDNESEENIIVKGVPAPDNQHIMKSVTYSVRVDEEGKMRDRDDRGAGRFDL
ncbi:hypothetical protein MKZ38_004678 [Zalerion maritima]|uniref:Rhodopsin domain-containing protein n=1 Tax=Zalerion maritima TaxID=339359 RepID=A0AAD5RL83_9PEZI|nr:hypothetical protein MKZ38_004678 [Zalerion maritima]